MPVMFAYLAIGIPCGVLEAQIGFGAPLAFLCSVTFYSGAGQFMLPQMLLAGMPMASTLASIVLVSTRQMLYSAGVALYVAEGAAPTNFLFAATMTDESFGVNLDCFAHEAGWSARDALALNVCCMLSWATANAVGVVVGGLVSMPVAIMSFSMTSIFICLMVGQLKARPSRVAALVSVGAVFVCKLLGLAGVAVLVGSVCGVLAGLLAQARGEVRA